MINGTCSVGGCSKVGPLTRGMCNRHYRADQLTRMPPCSTDGCGKPASKRGMCYGCYGRWMRTGSTDYIRPPAIEGECAEPGCGKDARSRGMCDRHYQRWYRSQPEYQRGFSGPCDKDDCDEPARRRGMCDGHYSAWLRETRAEKTRQSRLAYRERNRERIAAVYRAWEARNPEKVSLRDRRNKGRRRAAKGGETLNYELILAEFGMVCHICRDAIDSFDDLHMDHVIPLARGGTHTYDNVRPAHETCNLRKGSKLLSEYLAEVSGQAA